MRYDTITRDKHDVARYDGMRHDTDMVRYDTIRYDTMRLCAMQCDVMSYSFSLDLTITPILHRYHV